MTISMHCDPFPNGAIAIATNPPPFLRRAPTHTQRGSSAASILQMMVSCAFSSMISLVNQALGDRNANTSHYPTSVSQKSSVSKASTLGTPGPCDVEATVLIIKHRWRNRTGKDETPILESLD